MKNLDVIHQRIPATFSYPVCFTRNALDPHNACFDQVMPGPEEPGEPLRVLCFIDEGVHRHHVDIPDRVAARLSALSPRVRLVREPRIVKGGEAVKNDYRLIMEMVDTLLEYRLCRHSVVLAIGGGAVLDAVGFAASLVHRGVRIVRVPTTVLAQADAGVGVKNGMNLHGGKNTVGTFQPPFAVINDFDFLDTLEFPDWIGGVSEAFKVALIKDAAFLDFLCREAGRIRARNPDVIEQVIRRCAALHLEHLREGGDPFEMGTARPLDFGHWSAHKLESMTRYRIRHGEAVATGIALDTLLAASFNWVPREVCEKALQGLEACGFHVWHEEMQRRLGDGRLELLQGLDDFREHLGGRLTLTFPYGPGSSRDVHVIDEMRIEDAVEQLKVRAGVRQEAR